MNEVEIHIPSDHVFERIVRDSAAVVARYLGFPEDRTADLQLAVSEAVNNAIEHGNGGRFDVQVGVHFVLDDDRLAIRVIDHGGGVPSLTDHLTMSIDEKLEEDTPRGLGIFLIQQLVDGVETRTGEGRTEFVMWFDLKQAPSLAPAGGDRQRSDSGEESYA